MSRKPEKIEDSNNLKGTLISVLTIGVFIILTWFGAYAFYLVR